MLAREWQEALDAGQVSSKAALAAKLGVSRARVTQVFQLLKLVPRVHDLAPPNESRLNVTVGGIWT